MRRYHKGDKGIKADDEKAGTLYPFPDKLVLTVDCGGSSVEIVVNKESVLCNVGS